MKVNIPTDHRERISRAYQLAVERQLQILNAIDQFEDKKRKIRVAADGLRPGLDFSAGASIESERPTDYTKFDPDSTVPAPAGSYVIHHAGKIHYDGAKDGEAIIQVWGMGPATSIPAEKR